MKIDDLIYTGKLEPKILSRGKILDYEYIIVSYGTHPCCYVGKKDLFGMAIINGDFWSLESVYDKINVHGGITYSSSEVKLNFMDKDTDYLGWDYAHAFDYKKYSGLELKTNEKCKKWTFNELYEEVVNAIEQLMEYEEEFKETPRI